MVPNIILLTKQDQEIQLTTWELLHNNISHDLIVDNYIKDN